MVNTLVAFYIGILLSRIKLSVEENVMSSGISQQHYAVRVCVFMCACVHNCLGQVMHLTSFRQSVTTLKTDVLAGIQMLQPLQQTSG